MERIESEQDKRKNGYHADCLAYAGDKYLLPMTSEQWSLDRKTTRNSGKNEDCKYPLQNIIYELGLKSPR